MLLSQDYLSCTGVLLRLSRKNESGDGNNPIASEETDIYIVLFSRITANGIPNGFANKDRPGRICVVDRQLTGSACRVAARTEPRPTGASPYRQLLQLLVSTYSLNSARSFATFPNLCSLVTRMENFLSAAGGLDGAGESSVELPKRERSASPFEINRNTGRQSLPEMVWDYIKPPMEEVADHLVYMLGIRLSEINVAEGLAVVLYESRDKPWEFHHGLSRHLWDEIRHSMMGEAAIEAIYGDPHAIPMREYERVYCMEAPPLEQYATLGIEIEGGQMRYPVGKRGEWEFCRDAVKSPLMTTFQDFDWADEVLHVNLARRRLSDWFPGGTKELSSFAQQGRLKRTEVKERHAPVKLTVPAPASGIREPDC
jgi:hypothetical protein